MGQQLLYGHLLSMLTPPAWAGSWVRRTFVTYASSALLIFPIASNTSPTSATTQTVRITGAESFIQVRDKTKLTIEKGARVSHLLAGGYSETIIKAGSNVSHITVSENASLHVVGANIAWLKVEGRGKVDIQRTTILGGTFSAPGVSVGGGGIVYTSDALIYIHADNTYFRDGKIYGVWDNGEHFSIWLIQNIGTTENPRFRLAQALPTSVVIRELTGPSYDCRRATTYAEKTICTDADLSRLDKKLSETYKQVLSGTNDKNQVRQAQHLWLSESRSKCTNRLCLKNSYEARISALVTSSHWMTNKKAEEICQSVVTAVNDGSIKKRFLPFRAASEGERKQWGATNSPSSGLYVTSTLKVNYQGTQRTLALIQGGGTCGNCDIVDLASKDMELYPTDDEDRLQKAGWGQCDHFLFVNGEPIVVTGNFRAGWSELSRVAWIAPDGAKRALCLLRPTGETKTEVLVNENPRLCKQVPENRVRKVQLSDSVALPRNTSGESIGGWGRWDDNSGAILDINLDGRKERISLFSYAHSGGCGSYHQWFHELTADQTAVAKTSLNSLLANTISTHIVGSGKETEWYSVKLFEYQDRPYILGRGVGSTPTVVSVWKNQLKIWCEYQLLPQHQIDVLYPVESWPKPATSNRTATP